MMFRQLFLFVLLVALAFCSGCSGNAPDAKEPQAIPAAPVPAPSKEVTPQAAQEPQESTDQKPAEALSENKADAKAFRPAGNGAKPKLPPSAAPEKKANPSGNPTGYISRKDVFLQSEPSASAEKKSSLKIYEAVIILETKMTDESGKSFDVPQWYKVQLANKQVGWVVSRSVTVN